MCIRDSIGAASIVAKVYRDRLMETYDAVYPGYGFAANKGYGSAEHIAAIQRLGLTPIHRRSFVKNLRPQEGDVYKRQGYRGCHLYCVSTSLRPEYCFAGRIQMPSHPDCLFLW